MTTQNKEETAAPGAMIKMVLAWLLVGIPLAWGVAQTVLKALPLFQ
ncbi:hypothetical protein GCM10008955_09500 [Deinococcus malanensis]|uniref:Oxalate:formate antiporter n=1 Tax=Deinococcus malanensis TaxID=1706855 RepID=A0ABQ2ENS3_9DEIO|nr:hypothetical protein [Deinococcus malanensis]GGK18182.1 hypothetical protein GCM10008955_09500 [Deinococcus malanensis]